MVAQPSPTFRRRRLGRRLKQLRDQAGMTLDEVAVRLDRTRSAINRMETGKARIDVNVVRTLMDIYDIRDDSLIDLAREALHRGWWSIYGIRDLGYIGMETEASTVLELALVNIPGLLQTEDYMRAVFNNGRMRRTPERLEKDVAARLYRQQRLVDDEAPLMIRAIIDEAALHKEVGGVEVMRPQLLHLIEQSRLDTVTVQVLPNRAGAHAGIDGAFIVLRFVDAEDPDLLYVPYPTGSIHVEKDEEVAQARMVFDQLRSQALTPRDSAALMERVAREL
jgi:transcriptional regulator with XRE-family HTH domain